MTADISPSHLWPQGKQNQILVIVVGAIVVVGLIVWLAAFRGREDNGTPEETTQEPPAADAPETLGAEIFDETQNPIEGKIGGGNPVEGANPLEGVYQNPFGG